MFTQDNASTTETLNSFLISCDFKQSKEQWLLTVSKPRLKDEEDNSKISVSSWQVKPIELLIPKPKLYSTGIRNSVKLNEEPIISYDPFEEKAIVPKQSKPILVMVSRGNPKENILPVTETFFANIFGRETTLSATEVLLIGIPDGRLFWSELKNQTLKLLCDIEQPIIGIHCITDVIIVLGLNGKVNLISKAECGLKTCYVSGPVISSCQFKQCVYFSTVNGELYKAEIVSEVNDIVFQRLPFNNVHFVKSIPEYLYYVDKNNVSYRLREAKLKTITNNNYNHCQSENLLSSIQTLTDKVDKEKNKISLYKNLLHDLSIGYWLNSNPNLFRAEYKVERILDTFQYCITVMLWGLERLLLTNNWFMVCSLETHLSLESVCKEAVKICKSVKIVNSTQNVKLQIEVSQRSKHGTLQIPLKLVCSLMLNYDSRLTTELKHYMPFYPFSFDIKTWMITEVSFLEKLGSNWISHDESIDRFRQCLQELNRKRRSTALAVGYSITEKMTAMLPICKKVIEELFPITIDEEYNLSNQIFHHITNNDKLKNCDDLVLLNESLKIAISEGDKSLQVLTLTTSKLITLASVRCALTQIIFQLLKQSKTMQEYVAVSKVAWQKSALFKRELQTQNSSLGTDPTEMYKVIRNELSSSLPLL